MPFNSLAFVCFFILFVIAYYSLKNRTVVALAGSYLFYTYAGVSSLLFLLLITLITYFALLLFRIYNTNKSVLYFSISGIVLVLLSSKYWLQIKIIFFGEEYFENFSGGSFIFPIGISFYALQAVSLLLEVKLNRYKEKLTYKKVALYISFFPQSLAGPIHRPKELIPQFSETKLFDPNSIVIGVKNLLFGFFLKLIVADKIALVISPVFSKWVEADGLILLIATFLYSLQIYFDFWGYSLIAIGLGRILGYDIKINFRHPYSSTSMKEFWHRWHISLSQWMRDYIYLPFGGRRKGYYNFAAGILVTFIVSGLWHGLSFNFLLWGALHAVLYLLEDLKLRNKFRLKEFLPPVNQFVFALKKCFLFVVISFTWLVFRTEELVNLKGIFGKIFFPFEPWSPELSYQYYFTGLNLVYTLAAIITFAVSHSLFLERKINRVPIQRWERISDSTYTCFCLTAIILFGDIGGQEFLYFRF